MAKVYIKFVIFILAIFEIMFLHTQKLKPGFLECQNFFVKERKWLKFGINGENSFEEGKYMYCSSFRKVSKVWFTIGLEKKVVLLTLIHPVRWFTSLVLSVKQV